MTAARIDVGRLTQQECEELLTEIVDALPEDDLLRILGDKLTVGQLETILEMLP